MPNNPEMPTLAPEQGGDEIEQLLSQLSPEQLEQLASELSSYMQSPEQAGEGHIGELASAIEAHLSQNPEAASPEDIAPEKMAAFALVKSAAYIEGFLNQAVAGGADIKQAVDMYDNSLTETLMNLKQAALKGNQYKLDVDKDGKIEASDLAKLRHEKSESPKQEKHEHMDKVKEAAYYEGFFERGREYGFSNNETLAIIKSANAGFLPGMDMHEPSVNDWAPSKAEEMQSLLRSLPGKAMSAGREGLEALRGLPGKAMSAGREGLEALRGLPGKAMESGREALESGRGAVNDLKHELECALAEGSISPGEFMQIVKDHPYIAAGGGLAAAGAIGGGAALANYLGNRKQKKAADLSSLKNMFAQSLGYGTGNEPFKLDPSKLTEPFSTPIEPGDPGFTSSLSTVKNQLLDPMDYDSDYLSEYSPQFKLRDYIEKSPDSSPGFRTDLTSGGEAGYAAKLKNLLEEGKHKGQEFLAAGKDKAQGVLNKGQEGMDWIKQHGQEGLNWAGNHMPEIGGVALGGAAALSLAHYLRNKNKQKEQEA